MKWPMEVSPRVVLSRSGSGGFAPYPPEFEMGSTLDQLRSSDIPQVFRQRRLNKGPRMITRRT